MRYENNHAVFRFGSILCEQAGKREVEGAIAWETSIHDATVDGVTLLPESDSAPLPEWLVNPSWVVNA